MRLQHNKCAYCERELETAHELDIEHFRPKNRVQPWPEAPIPHSNGRPDGYYWLAYEITNYFVACKPCNSGLKRDYFPIAGKAGKEHQRIDSLDAVEKPLLIFPMGLKDDPEKLIGWLGVIPFPLAVAGSHDHKRAQTTIEFFQLKERDLLRRCRATLLLLLWNDLKPATNPISSEAERTEAQKKVAAWLENPKNQMRACMKALARLATEDHVKAAGMIEAIRLITNPDRH
jgi:uncharacterized protein (TIGR02646 family)